MPEMPDDVVSALDEQRPHHPICYLGDPEFGVPHAGLITPRYESEIGSHLAALFEAPRLLDGQQETQRRQWTDPVHLLQEFGSGVGALAESWILASKTPIFEVRVAMVSMTGARISLMGLGRCSSWR